MGKNYAIFRAEKLKSHNDIVNVLKEQQRFDSYESDRADPEREHLNTYSGTYQDAIDLYDTLLPAKVRKNAVMGLMFVVSASQEFDSREAEDSYYTMARDFISERFGTVVGWSIHRDETSTHMQVVTIPLKDGKLNARELIGGDKHRMQQLQQAFYDEVGAPHGLVRGESNPRTRHVSAEEFHRQTLKEDQERAENLDTREIDLIHREDEAEAILDSVVSAQNLAAQVEQEKREWDEERQLRMNEATKKLYADNKAMYEQLHGGSGVGTLTTPDGWKVKVKNGLLKFAAEIYDKLQRYLHMTPKEFEQDYNKRQVQTLLRRKKDSQTHEKGSQSDDWSISG